MKLLTSKNTYAASNCDLEVSPDCKRVFAHSYSWWTFVATDSVGNIYFNDSTYSISTSKHQNNIRNILDRLSIRVNLRIRNTTEGFGNAGGCYGRGYPVGLESNRDDIDSNIKRALDKSIQSHRDSIRELIENVNKKGSKKRKNADRRDDIKSQWYAIKDLRNIRDNYVGKKLIPIKRVSIADLVKSDHKSPHFIKLGMDKSQVKAINSYKRYFKKQNGKVQVNELTAFLNKLNSRYLKAASLNIEGLKVLFQLKAKDSIESILLYKYSNDLNNMLPNIDSDEHRSLLKYMARMNITKESLTTLSLDKLHTYLVNKTNRKAYSPSAPIELPVHPVVAGLDRIKEVKLIRTVQDLRREGREQSHCIGSKGYIEKARGGHQALRYKGYTFWLSPQLDILQSNGKHNSRTPAQIEYELRSLLTCNNMASSEAS